MKQTAQGLAALGRGPDTQLVHMAPSEVQSLQQLAMANGGSLTINPTTGLPEAGFLSSILPMVIGAGLMAATGGTAAPLIAGMSNAATIGLGVGGLQALRTGSLSKGLMAGLGAYGGAGLAGGLMGAGTEAISAAGAGAQAPVGAIVPEVVAPATDFAAGNVNAGLTAANEAQLVASNAANVPAYYGPSVGAEAANVGLPQTVTQAPVLATPVAPTGPVPTMSPTGDFARFDRAMSPGLGASSTEQLGAGLKSAATSPLDFAKANKMPLGAIGLSALLGSESEGGVGPAQNQGMIRPYTYSREKVPSAFQDVAGAPRSSVERRYFTDQYTALTPYKAPGPEYMAAGGPVEDMSNANALGASTGYPQSDIRTGAYSSPFQQPMGQNVVTGAQDAAVDPYTGQAQFAKGGGISDLGDYSDGGRLLRGPGDGVSDNIPAVIGKKRPARLADGEFVVPARIVSELGNGSTEAGARKLYAMMERVQKSRGKTVGKGKVAVDNKSFKHLPA